MVQMNRREFIGNNLIAIPAIKTMSQFEVIKPFAGKTIKYYCPRWGATDSWDAFCKRVKAAGYDGIEASLSSPQAPEKQEILEALKKHELELIGQYWQSREHNVDEHAIQYEAYLKSLATLKPKSINAQTGKDYFSFDENKKLFDIATRITKEYGIEVIHETHRGKALFAAHITKQYLEKFPDLRLTLDISHWCNVHESLLADQTTAVDLALSRTVHIHSRIGHAEGPQVNDPRAPEWNTAVKAHLTWWDKVVALHEKTQKTLTVTTEFGPPHYMPVLPYTQQPVSSQWDINVYMMNFLKQRYQ